MELSTSLRYAWFSDFGEMSERYLSCIMNAAREKEASKSVVRGSAQKGYLFKPRICVT